MARKCIAVLLLVCLLAALPVQAMGVESVTPYIQRMINYYLYYQENAQREIDVLLDYIGSLDPEQEQLWRGIMDSWSWVNAGMEVPVGVLPDGLPEDESLCIVVLGYDLNDNGSMKPELLQRLEVVRASAEKYPNAWVLVSGGQTAAVPGASEAGVMYDWLRSNGVARERIIQEKDSYNTTENALNVAKLLENNYPGVDTVAVITSDYHIQWGSALLAAALHKVGAGVRVAAGAVCGTGKQMDTLYTQAWGICDITGVPFAEATSTPAVLPLDPTEALELNPRETVEETAPAVLVTEPEAPAEAVEEKEGSYGFLLVLIPFAVGLYILTPKKPRKKRPKPEWKREE